jgi:cold shock CspA family protein
MDVIMRTLFIAAASALFFAAVVTELYMRLWPEQYFALLVLCFAALLCSGLLNLRLATRPRSVAAPAVDVSATPSRAQRPPRSAAESERPRQRQTPAARRDNGEPRRAERRAEPPAQGPRESGSVKWFNRTKGFGFIIRASGEEIFVHQRSIRATGEGDERRRPALRDGQAVTFVVAERDKGLQAEDVVPADDA